MNNEQIMIVEDDNELNRGLCTAFRSEGRNVICVSTISEARDQLLLFKPALILMDINLHDGSGLDLLGEVKKEDNKPIIFAFHGYPKLIHELTYARHNHNIHVYGYHEEGTITTPFDMRVQNEIDRFDLVIAMINHIESLGNKGSFLIQKMRDKLVAHKTYIHDVGIDMPEVAEWKWTGIK